MNISARTHPEYTDILHGMKSGHLPASAADIAQAEKVASPEAHAYAVADTFSPSVPTFAQAPLAALKSGEVPEGLSKAPGTEADKQEAAKAAFAASILSSYDEVAGKDGAMGQKGVVINGGLTCEFTVPGKKQIEALLYGPGKTGEPSALYVKSGPEGLTSYGFLDKGATIEVRGQVFGSNGGDGYVVAGHTPDAT